MHFAAHVRTWRVAQLYSIQYSEIAVSQNLFRIGRMHIYTLLPRILTLYISHESQRAGIWASQTTVYRIQKHTTVRKGAGKAQSV
jgi:hypothetical protein